jgi:hypothetical protein
MIRMPCADGTRPIVTGQALCFFLLPERTNAQSKFGELRHGETGQRTEKTGFVTETLERKHGRAGRDLL